MKIDCCYSCDILVVGGGIAGLVSAYKSAKAGKNVILAVNDKICSGASYFPLKGTLGIQATAGEKDKKLFYEDIAEMGKGMENPKMINTYIDEINENISALNEIGFEPWLRNDKRPACFAKYPRNIYLIKDWEKSREKAVKILRSIPNLKIIEEAELFHISKKDEKVCGGIFQMKDRFISVEASAVITATGGVAGLYKNNLYPSKVAGAGHIAVLDAGAEAQNMEFIQFIPAFVKPVYNTLFGEHTLKYCTGMYDENKNLIMEGICNKDLKNLWIERSSYAPFSFDFKSREIDIKMSRALSEENNGVVLKFSKELYENTEEFYVVFLNWLKNQMGIDMCRDEVVVAPFAHSCNGGIVINENGETGVQGLYAVGELSSGVEGANRLGGNSMGGSLVFGTRAVKNAVEYIKNCKKCGSGYLEEEFNFWLESILKNDGENILSSEEAEEKIKNILNLAGNICRNEKNLKNGLEEIKNLKKSYSIKNNLAGRGLNIYFKMETAEMLFSTMLERKESRGAHYREDYPYTDEKIYKLIISRKENKFEIAKNFVK